MRPLILFAFFSELGKGLGLTTTNCPYSFSSTRPCSRMPWPRSRGRSHERDRRPVQTLDEPIRTEAYDADHQIRSEPSKRSLVPLNPMVQECDSCKP
jgi:hypothetical protein